MKKVAFHNLGCKVNSYELDVMRQILSADGYEEVSFQDRADIYVVNTCTVTNIADRKSRQMLHRAKKQNPDAIVIAVGCYVETDPGRVEKDDAVDLVIGNNKKSEVGRILSSYLASREEKAADRSVPEQAEHEPRQDVFSGNALQKRSGKPVIREDLTCSPAFEDMSLQEVAGLVEKGIREVVLTGIHVSSYGLDIGADGPVRFDPVRAGEALLDLFGELNALQGLERIRLSSLEPRIMTERFIRGISGMKKICPHFHLSLQSGCDETLRRMNRHYTTAQYAESVRLLRQYYDRPAITTDVIVGFPGETEEEFETTCAFLEQIGFYEIHVFRYSRRNGTAAAKMKNQIPEPVKAVRSDRLLSMTQAQASAYRAQFTGEEETLLLEEICQYKGKQYWVGNTMRYVTGAVPIEPSEKSSELSWNMELAPGMLLKGTVSGKTIPFSRGDAILFLKK